MNNVVQVQLYRRRLTDEPPLFTTIDADDLQRVSTHRWYEAAGYVCAYIKGKGMKLHAFLIGAPFSKTMVVDHINGNPLDNRKCNLRICTPAQNMSNRRKAAKGSRFKGVTICVGRRHTSIVARICHQGKTIHLGAFRSDIDAALAYDAAARKYFGQFAWCNFPDDKLPAGVEPILATELTRLRGGQYRRIEIELPESIAEMVISAAAISNQKPSVFLRQFVINHFSKMTERAA